MIYIILFFRETNKQTKKNKREIDLICNVLDKTMEQVHFEFFSEQVTPTY